MSMRSFNKGEVICLEGDPGDCMFIIEGGKAGVFEDYGKPSEKKVTDLGVGAMFGEMSLLDHEPRSATVVAMEDDTALQVISEENFRDFFEKSPQTAMKLAEQMSHRLRIVTKEYYEACRTVYDAVEVEKRGGKKSERLMERIKKLCSVHLNSRKAEA
ncbi:MAG: cyclic nucleotide-binding domain-containing protein [Lachnospiraceae bacterium]|nr:cyclic nucleotide-binding domain-containing protein [Lachnospiraceae bacterium]